MISLRALRFGLRARLAISRPTNPPRFLSQLTTRDELQRDQDQFIQQMKNATNAVDVFNIMTIPGRPLQTPELVSSMKSLFELQKLGISSASDIVNHPGFEGLCKKLRTKCRNMDYNEIVDIIKILSFLGVPPNAEIYHVFLNLAKQEINSATLMQIVFLDFVLQKVDPKKNPLVDALRISFPIVFQMHISSQIDHENIPQLIDFLGFISRNRVDRKTALIVMNALILHGDNFSADEARKIAWSLCDDVNPCSDQRLKLFNNVMDCLSQKLDQLHVEVLENTISKMAKKYARHPNMYHERILNETAHLLMDQNIDFTRITYFLKGLNRMGFVHLKLCHHMLVQIQRDPSALETCRPTSILSLISALSNANFRTYLANFKQALVPSLFANPLFSRDLVEFPWTKLACDLAALGIFDDRLTEKILSPEFLDQYLARESTIDYLQFLKFYQSGMLLDNQADRVDLSSYKNRAKNVVLSKIEFPLQTSLEFAFGGQEYVRTKVLTKYFHLVDHVLQFNAKKDICKFWESREEDGTWSLESLQTSAADITTVAVMGLPASYFTSNLGTLKGSFDLQLRTLGKLGLVVVPVDLGLWFNLPDREKIPFLQREIKSRL